MYQLIVAQIDIYRDCASSDEPVNMKPSTTFWDEPKNESKKCKKCGTAGIKHTLKINKIFSFKWIVRT